MINGEMKQEKESLNDRISWNLAGKNSVEQTAAVFVILFCYYFFANIGIFFPTSMVS